MSLENNPHPKALDPAARTYARQYALQAMYQWQLTHTPIKELEIEFLHFRIDKKFDQDYFKTLIHGVIETIDEVDEAIQPFLGRKQQDIDPIELAVLRLATYEILKRIDVPYRVVINEALKLTKKFGSIEGYRFVNGVLDRIAKKARSIEIDMEQTNTHGRK